MNATVTDHIKRINQTIHYIEGNLNANLSLDKLARAASYSPYHFHRLFTNLKGESPIAFVRRKRIEKIAWLLLKDKQLLISDVVRKYGFDNDASFSKAFKKFYGISASAMRNMSTTEFNKINRKNSKKGKESISIDAYFASINQLKDWMQKNEVQIEPINLGEQSYITLRNTGDWKLSNDSFERLNSMVTKHQIPALTFPWSLIIHDNPAITEEQHVSHSSGYRIDREHNLENEEAVTLSIPSGRFLVGSFKIKDEDFRYAWGALSITAMEQGYTYRDGTYFERFQGDTVLHPGAEHNVELCIPID